MSDETSKTGATEDTSSPATKDAGETAAEAAAEATAEAATDTAGAETAKAEAGKAETPAPDPLAVLKAENAELKEKYLRLYADMDNLRKRLEREKADTAKYAISEFARDIIPLSDNFQRAISAVSPEAAEKDEALKSFLDGIELTERELQRVLERHGVVKIDPKGEKVDPNLHQVVQQIEDASLPHNTVCDVYQVGYMIADRVLRTAMVAVSRGGPKDGAAAPKEAAEPGAHVDKNV
jgi:molecular chaperone GrpE